MTPGRRENNLNRIRHLHRPTTGRILRRDYIRRLFNGNEEIVPVVDLIRQKLMEDAISIAKVNNRDYPIVTDMVQALIRHGFAYYQNTPTVPGINIFSYKHYLLRSVIFTEIIYVST